MEACRLSSVKRQRNGDLGKTQNGRLRQEVNHAPFVNDEGRIEEKEQKIFFKKPGELRRGPGPSRPVALVLQLRSRAGVQREPEASLPAGNSSTAGSSRGGI